MAGGPEDFDTLYGRERREDTAVALWAAAAGGMLLLALAAVLLGGPDTRRIVADPIETGSVRRMDLATFTPPARAGSGDATELLQLRRTVDMLRGDNEALSRRVAVLEARVAGSSLPTADRVVYGIELGLFADGGALAARWHDLRAVYGDLLAPLEAVAAERNRGERTDLALVAGPFASAADARERCTRAESLGLACAPTFFSGTPVEP